MRWPAKAEEFINFVNQSIAPESELPPMTADMLKRWSDWGVFHHIPAYYRDDFSMAIALLKNEAYLRQQLSSRLTQPAQACESGELQVAFQKGITQVVSCMVGSLIEEQLIIQGLKDTNLIGSAGQIAVNFHPFSDKPVEIPSAGAEAKEGDALIIEIQDSGELEWGPVMTPLGKREFTPDDTWFKTLSNLDSERKPELLWQTEQQIPPKTTKRMKFPWPPERSKASVSINDKAPKQFNRSLFSTPIFVPVVAIKGVLATMVESVYITPNGQRVPPLPRHKTPFPSRLYPAFLNADGSSIQKIVDFITNYGLTLRFKSSTGDPQGDFCADQQKMRDLLVEARNGNLSFEDIQQLSPLHEDALVEQDFIEALLLAPDHVDYISECRRACSPEEQKSKFLPVRRYYSWFDRMWTEVLEDVGQGLIPPLCKGCDKILSPPSERKRGRKREYCPNCERTRGKDRFHRWWLRKREESF